MRCPACKLADLEVFFAMSAVPIFCNVFAASAAEARAAPRGDIRLGFCGACGMIHNTAFDPALVAYTPDYETSLHFSSHFREFAEGTAKRLIADHHLESKDVVEIGCGRGDFLALLTAEGSNRGIGFDASYDDNQADAVGSGLTIHREFYTAQTHPDVHADLLVCRHVLEHIEDPGAFLAALKPAIRPGGVLYLEVPDAMFTLRDLGIWDIIYEHCSYFTAPTLEALFVRAGYRPLSVDSRFGGQFLCIEASREHSHTTPAALADDSVQTVRERQRVFTTEFDAKLAHWNTTLEEKLARDQRIAIWGAGSKGVTFLNTVARGAEVTAVIDINARKHGRHVSGTGQRIESPASIPDLGIDVVLVMNANYLDEIRAQCRDSGTEPEFLTV